MIRELNAAIEQSDITASREIYASLLRGGKEEPWGIHDAVYAVVHQVLNPPFINPHLSKMYSINRELAAYLTPAESALLVGVELEEYTRREKLPALEKPVDVVSTTYFDDVEKIISSKDSAATAAAMAAFLMAAGPREFSRKLLLLGSGYLDKSLGHSISCSAFILLEMMRRKDQNPWPALVILADYFCKGGFDTTPELLGTGTGDGSGEYFTKLCKAVSGTGFVPLHHTITLYAIERSRHLLERQEYIHMLAMWTAMIGEKEENIHPVDDVVAVDIPDFKHFYTIFSRHDTQQLMPMIAGSLSSEEKRGLLARYVILSVLENYNGHYDPHILTGLGSAVWVMQKFHERPEVVMNAWLQYLDYFFSEI